MSEIARQERTRRQRRAAPGSAHDRLIATLMVALPIAIGVLAAFLVMAPLFMRGDTSFVLDKNKVDVAQERMRLRAAEYRGQDAKGQPFVLDAGSAVQKSSAEPVVQMQELAAGIRLPDGPARLTAPRGRYDMRSEQVDVLGPIQFRAANGYSLDTTNATVDLKTRRLRSGGAVTGTTSMGNFSGDRLDADLEARTVRLTGNARLRIDPARTK
ncbi:MULTISPECIES: LPS export ABC transporter periplasmic protein LptC [Sphingomonas]|jgi:lipopolysaccharide export system protein LptC|uniref:LPS export ABC transporter periplasmic protein LptC n=1 Tax=Sphingomonas hankookensis TaxID=563996 RepID=A0ABR5YA35_9SPHN|nr:MULTISPECIES: LPS export ABC transporter periplasmic protein LptC [Sphingomonas]KZE11139.1 LPS export ABC transporter periplasmic protein LptC [Sphingomonas hankookensis]PZT90710.1 MAG: LPS export ABC transporter periplasmic protein LptC [Sphingomonas sp.]RSV24210.1 LPS export ABC transporter periplasmic protein LptC [Sphingomonas sp. ABOLH]WCP72589.1 LPS export ABC transporter periplasmic protein LptC [Sphingomonas hankookensis]